MKPGCPVRDRLWATGAICLLALLTCFQFPGRTWLASDSQIYAPLLEHARNSGLFGREILIGASHLQFTIYDEVTLGLARLTGGSLETVLASEQFVFRAICLWGVFLFAGATGLRARPALLVTAAFALGAAIPGPTVLTIEYEPVPRAFAIALVFLALGLAAVGRPLAAGAACAVAVLFHASSVPPFLAAGLVYVVWPGEAEPRWRRTMVVLAPAGALILLLCVASIQTGLGRAADLFGSIAPDVERIERLRAPYNWVSLWVSVWWPHYLALGAVAAAALWRVRRLAPRRASVFAAALPLAGLLSVPFAWLLLERGKWILAPEIQPARALLFVTALAVILSAVAAVKAGTEGRRIECFLWFVPVYAVPVCAPVFDVFSGVGMAAAVTALAALSTAAVCAAGKADHFGVATWAAAAVLPFFLLPLAAGARAAVAAETPAVAQLAAWARSATSQDAVFLFPASGRGLAPGVFRARALRALYVDWKGGGQVNYSPGFARLWYQRWLRAGAGRFHQEAVAGYAALGIDYVVLEAPHRLPDRPPVYENTRFAAYRLH
jgi:hypothetical protein